MSFLSKITLLTLTRDFFSIPNYTDIPHLLKNIWRDFHIVLTMQLCDFIKFFPSIFRCLEEAISLQKLIKEDFFIIPYAIVEIALLHIDQKNLELAINCLEDAKKNYTGYSLEVIFF